MPERLRPSNPLLVSVTGHADSGNCPALAASRDKSQSRATATTRVLTGADGGEHTGMVAR